MIKKYLLVKTILLLFCYVNVPLFAYEWKQNPSTGHYYSLTSSLKSWADSEAEAQSLGGHLVTIRSQAENDWLKSNFTQNNLWIGLYQLPGSIEPGGGWVWVSGESSSYRNWRNVEPNNAGGNEDRGMISPGGWELGVWNDLSGSALQYGIIERQSLEVWVSNISASQRTDGSGLIDVYYTLVNTNGYNCTVSIVASNDGGASWDIIPSASALSGDVGASIVPGLNHIIWNSKADLPSVYGTNFKVKVKSQVNLLQNTEFETDLAGWTIGTNYPLETWDVQWSEDHGGSAKMYISGAPAQASISQETQIVITPGDQLTVNVYHSNMGNFSNWYLIIEPGPSQVLLYGAGGPEGSDSIAWTADQQYDPGTLISVGCSVWPGSSTTWVENLIVPSHVASGLSNIFTIDNSFDYSDTILPDDSQLGNNTDISGASNDPVNTATGNFYHNKTDLTIATRSIPFEFKRYYNSKDNTSGPLGIGWTHSYNISLTDDVNLVSVRWPDGRTDYWDSNGFGGYDPNIPGLYDSLEKDGSNWVVRKKNLDEYTFDSNGILKTIKDKNGNTFTLGYNGSSQLISVTDPAARAITFAYDPDDKLASVTDFAVPIRTVQYLYNIGGKLTQVTDVLGSTIDYTYDSNGYLAVINDQRDVNTVSNVYDANGRVIQQTNGNGNITTFTYGTEGEFNKTTITNPDTTEIDHLHSQNNILLMIRYPIGSISYAYDANNNRTSIVDRNGNVTSFAYDSRGNVTSTTDPNDPADGNDGGITAVEYNDSNFPDLPTKKTNALGRITLWEYDPNGNVERQVNPDGNDTIWTYNSFGQKLTETDENNNATTYIYDSNGLLTQVTDANGNNTWFDYDELWRLTEVTDGRGSGAGDASHTTTSVYDAADRIISASGPITSQSYEYDQIGNRTKATNGRGYETLYEYDNNKNLTRTERVVPSDANQVIQYGYDGLDRKITMTDPNGNITQYEYDALGRVTKEINPELDETIYTYDAHGNVLSVTDGSGVTTTYEYDRLHRKIRQSDELSNNWQWQYDKLGNLTKHTDAKGNVTQYSYDTLSRLVLVTDATNGTTSYEYDAVGNLTQITDANSKIIAKKYYDVVNRLVRKEDGHVNAFEYSYDGAGNLISVKDPDSQTKTMVYDNENRLTEVHYPDASQVIYTYDDNGNLASMTDSTGTTSYAYDELDRLISSNDSFGKAVQYNYDINGNRTGITYPADSTKPARTVNYTYDAANRLDKITDWASRGWDYTTDGAGRVIDVNYPSGVIESRTYDDAARLSGLSYEKSDTTPILSFSYTRDSQGNPTGTNESGTLPPDLSAMFGKIDYTYDIDNLLTFTTPASYGYDNKGNMTSRFDGVTTTFAYDFENRLISQTTGGSSVQHTYDGMGNRIARNDNGATTRYVLDRGRDMSHVLCETDASGEIIAYYIHGPTIVGRIAADGTARYYHANAIGSVVALTDDTESVTDKYAYTPFGEPAGKTGLTANPFTYIGSFGVMAEDDGLYFMRARFYEPQTGRFIGKDSLEGTLQQPMSLYRYNYANDNPTVYVDPEGESVLALSVAYIALKGVASGAIAVYNGNDFMPAFIGGVVSGATDVAALAVTLSGLPYAGIAIQGAGEGIGYHISNSGNDPKPTMNMETVAPQTIGYSSSVLLPMGVPTSSGFIMQQMQIDPTGVAWRSDPVSLNKAIKGGTTVSY